MTEFVNMWKNYVNFSDRTSVRGFWMAFLFNMIAVTIIAIIAVVAGILWLSSIYALAVFLPGLAIAIRRLRDAGKSPAYIFIALIPFAGVILYIIALCKASIPDDGKPVV
ncbi:MAG: DUF805 domain-containing protein [Oscillospiraceae bacterium]|nr:DUF805 domain-containing protein [Oscillospiraceae bacterium]